MKDNHFKLSSSFQTAFSTNKDKTDKKSRSQPKDKQLFQLNPKTGNALDTLPIDVLRKNSKKKLQSLKDESKHNKDWSIFNTTKNNDKLQDVKPQKPIGKTYNFGQSNINLRKSKQSQDMQAQKPKEQLPYDVVRPSKITKNEQKIGLCQIEEKISPTIFQTPLLPCFQSEFDKNLRKNQQNKIIAETEGIWKIGKLKITKKNGKIIKKTLNINGIEFQANMAVAQGKSVSVMGTNMYEMMDWKGFWVVQPKEDLFTVKQSKS